MFNYDSHKLFFNSFLFFGLVVTICGIVMSVLTFNYSNKVDATGVIVDLNPVYIEYDVKGKTYVSKVSSNSSNWYVGKELKIYYDKDNVRKIGIKSMDYAWLMVIGVGFIFAGIPLSVKIYEKTKRSKRDYLITNGLKVDATYVKTIVHSNTYINGVNPYTIICSYVNPEDNGMYEFKSKYLYEDPKEFIRKNNITTFPVYIDKKNFKKYLVDIDSVFDNE